MSGGITMRAVAIRFSADQKMQKLMFDSPEAFTAAD